MNLKEEIINEIKVYFDKHPLLGDDFFVWLYGSFATDSHSMNSDIDVCVASSLYSKLDFVNFRDFYKFIHDKNSLNKDEEVPYENKLVISYKDIESALSLEPFLVSSSEEIFHVSTISSQKKVLRSRNVKLRLLFNALTTPSVFICGDISKYNYYKKEAGVALVRLAKGLASTPETDLEMLLKILISSEDGHTGRDYLGYKTDRVKVMDYLRNTVKENLN